MIKIRQQEQLYSDDLPDSRPQCPKSVAGRPILGISGTIGISKNKKGFTASMSENNELNTSRVAKTIFPSYDRAYVDMKTVVDVIYSKAIESFQWTNYIKSAENSKVSELKNTFLRLSLEEGQHESVIMALTDRHETVLEKAVAGQISHIVRLAQFISGEPQEAVRRVFEHILLDHLNHHLQFTNKLARKEGLSPMARADFPSTPGRELSKQLTGFQATLKTPYDKTTAAPLTKIQIRLALAQEMYIFQKHIGDIELCGDGHLALVYRQVALVDNLHIAMLQSLIDPSETEMESIYLWELAEVACFQQVSNGSSVSVEKPFAGVLIEDKRHLDILSSLALEATGISVSELSEPWPVIKSIDNVARIVEKVSKSVPSDNEAGLMPG